MSTLKKWWKVTNYPDKAIRDEYWETLDKVNTYLTHPTMQGSYTNDTLYEWRTNRLKQLEEVMNV